jgi:hypothetical protein
VQALSSAGDLVIPSRKAEMHPRIEWQRYKIDGNSVHVLTRLTRSGRCKPMSSVDGSRVARGKLTQWHWSGNKLDQLSQGAGPAERVADSFVVNSYSSRQSSSRGMGKFV